MGPAAKRGRIGYAVRVFERRRRLFPGIVLHKAPSQCLRARQQTVMGVRERKQWKKGESLPATGATAATDVDPVVVFIVGLLAAASMADNGIAFTSGHRRKITSAQLVAHSVSSLCGRTESGINRIVAHRGSAPPALTCQDLSRKQSSFLLKQNPTGREYSFSAMAF